VLEFSPQPIEGASLARRAYWRTLRPIRQAWEHRDLSAADVAIASFPRSGNLWVRVLLLQALTGTTPSFADVVRLVPPVGGHHSSPGVLPGGGRLIKTHERHRASYRRAIYIHRDPRDISLSYFKHLQRRGSLVVPPGQEDVGFDRFLDGFLAGRHEPHGTWERHVESWLNAAEARRSDVVVIRYETMRDDPEAQFARIVHWLGLDMDGAAVADVVAAARIERMRDMTSDFDATVARRQGHDPGQFSLVNSGRVGSWRALLSDEQQGRFRAVNAALARAGYDLAQ
jgi:hypothetical protein